MHDVLTCVGMEEADAVLGNPDDVTSGGTSINGRPDRIYLTRELAGNVVGYVQRDMRNSEHQALMLTLGGVAAVGAAPPDPGS